MENFKDLLLAKNPNYSAKTIETYATTWKQMKTMFERENDARVLLLIFRALKIKIYL